MTSLDNLTTTLEEVEALRADVKVHKERASRNSEDLMRSSREIGELRKQLQQVPALQGEIALLKEKNEDLAFKLSEAQRAIEKAEAEASKNAAKLAAFDRFAEAFRAVGAE